MDTAMPSGLGEAIVQEVEIAASREKVWEGLTLHTHNWWSHCFSEKPYQVELEAKVGGLFQEMFDTQGNGALYATVTFCQPPQKLVFVGQMGMQGPVLTQSVFVLDGLVDGGTKLRVSMEIMGTVDDKVRMGYKAGWGELLGHLKGLVEQGRKVRD
jgi:uncharacterized protein YndB with AHSA1/START domain